MGTTIILALLAQQQATKPPSTGKPFEVDIAQPGMLAVFVVGFLILCVVRWRIAKGRL